MQPYQVPRIIEEGLDGYFRDQQDLLAYRATHRDEKFVTNTDIEST